MNMAIPLAKDEYNEFSVGVWLCKFVDQQPGQQPGPDHRFSCAEIPLHIPLQQSFTMANRLSNQRILTSCSFLV
jgi:hypothetical protein